MVRFDDYLNGAGAAPEVAPVTTQSLPTRPADGPTDAATSTSTPSRTILIAWVALFALLVLTHVISIDVQA